MKTISEETRMKLRIAKLGKPSPTKGMHWKQNLSEKQREVKRELMRKIKNPHRLQPDENHYRWKGDRVGYFALHHWINKKLGHPLVCEHCGYSGKRLEWANIDHKYRRNLKDWIRLCKKCHCAYDRKLTKEEYEKAIS